MADQTKNDMYSDSQNLPQSGSPVPDSTNLNNDVIAVDPADNLAPEPPAPSPELLPTANTTAKAQVAGAADQIDLPPDRLLSAVWPTSSRIHQVAVLSVQTKAFRNETVVGMRAAVMFTAQRSAAGDDTYLAIAEFVDHHSRTAGNVASASALWMDIDCGPDKVAAGKGYASAIEAHAALESFCARNGFPAPTHIVDSGGGLHVYWAINQPLERAAWIAAAGQFKAVARACKFLADPTRTADIASVLRMPGTLNYKYAPPRLVRLLTAGAPLQRDELLLLINAAHESLCPALPISRTASIKGAGNNTFTPGEKFERSNLARLQSALKCLTPDCDDETWKLHRLAPVARVARKQPESSAALKEMMRAWSSGELSGQPSVAWVTPGSSNGQTGREVFDSTWNRFLGGEYGGHHATVATIFHDAIAAGWVDTTTDFEVLETPTVVIEVSEADRAAEMVDALLSRVKAGDVGAPLEPENVAVLTSLQPADYQRTRDKLKCANNKVQLGAVDKAVKASQARGDAAPTHHAYAKDTLQRLTVDGYQPVAYEGTLQVVDPTTNIWVPQTIQALTTLIPEDHDGKLNCTKRGDYVAIAEHATALVGNDAYFDMAPVGLACRDSFYRIDGEVTVVEPLTPAHRQRIQVGFTPTAMPIPLFSAFLHQTFQAAEEGEEAQQIALVQEIAGGIMLGLMHRHQKAVLFYDPFGRAGKGTLESILRELVPSKFVTAVSPFQWGGEYYVATLAGSRLNVVGELPDDKVMPSADFKSVIGGDLVTGRHPTHRPVTFKNRAAHLFMSNHMINTRDQSEAFFARWLIVEFPNSRLRLGLPLDPMLASRIVEQELPGIAHWALEGATRLLRNNGFSKSAAHDRLMQHWRRNNSSLHEFIHECCDLDARHTIRRAELYASYKTWCTDNGRKPFAKGRVKELLEYNVALGITLSTLHGNEICRGVKAKDTFELRSDWLKDSEDSAALY